LEKRLNYYKQKKGLNWVPFLLRFYPISVDYLKPSIPKLTIFLTLITP
jgi:hypothetical protein